MIVYNYIVCQNLGKRKPTFIWIQSIDLSSFDSSNEIVYSEYPISRDENTAKVSCLQEKLSREAFGGSAVRLLNSKNILIADTEGTCPFCVYVCVCLGIETEGEMGLVR